MLKTLEKTVGALRACIILILGLALSACAGGTLPQSTINEVADSVRQELLETYGDAYGGPKLTGLVSDVVAKLSSKADWPDGPPGELSVTILDSSIPYAAATLKKQIFITRGMIMLAKDSGELAAVLAHEIAHVTRGHSAHSIAYHERLGRQIVSENMLELRSHATRSARLRLFKKALTEKESEIRARVRVRELEADLIGTEIMKRAGYDPAKLASILGRLDRYTDSQYQLIDFDHRELRAESGYPEIKERLAAIGGAPAAGHSTSIEGPERSRLMEALDGVPYEEGALGFSVREGVVIDRVSRLAIDLPEAHLRASEAPVIVLPRKTVLFIKKSKMTQRDAREFEMSDVLAEFRERLDDRVVFSHVEQKDDISVVKFRTEWNDKTLVGAIAQAGQHIWLPLALYSEERSEKELTQLRDRIVASMRIASRPPVRTVSTRRARAGETAASLAASSELDGDALRKEQAFRELNGLLENEEVQPGQWIKIVR